MLAVFAPEESFLFCQNHLPRETNYGTESSQTTNVVTIDNRGEKEQAKTFWEGAKEEFADFFSGVFGKLKNKISSNYDSMV